MFNWIKKLFFDKTLREKGQEYAYEYLQKGGSYKRLEILVFSGDDFNDFDRGILDVVRRGSDGNKH